MWRNKITIVLMWFSVSFVYADVNENLHNFFDQIGVKSNLTEPGVYNDQAAGFYTGGSLYARSPISNQQLVHAQAPNWKYGCGGIDLFAGGMSFITAKQLVDTMKTIGSNAFPYAFMLGLKTVVPSIETTLSKLQGWAQNINDLNINTCDAATGILGGLWPKGEKSSQTYCETVGVHRGTFNSHLAAKHGCSAGGKRGEVNSGRHGEDSPFRDILQEDQFNIAWEAINKHGYLGKQGSEMAQFFMSLSGTIVVNNGKVYYYPSMSSNNALIDVILKGGETTIYGCKDGGPSGTKCLDVEKNRRLYIHGYNAFESRVRMILDEMVNKILTDQKLTNEEIAFLNSTSLPVYRMLNVVTAFHRGRSPLKISKYSEAIALDVLFQYFEEVLQVVIDSVTQQEKVQIDGEKMKTFKKELFLAKKAILDKRNECYQKSQVRFALVNEVQLIEKQLANQIDVGQDLR